MDANIKPLTEEIAYDVRDLINDSINTKIINITKNTQIFNAIDAITLAKKVIKYDEIRQKALTAIATITEE